MRMAEVGGEGPKACPGGVLTARPEAGHTTSMSSPAAATQSRGQLNGRGSREPRLSVCPGQRWRWAQAPQHQSLAMHSQASHLHTTGVVSDNGHALSRTSGITRSHGGITQLFVRGDQSEVLHLGPRD